MITSRPIPSQSTVPSYLKKQIQKKKIIKNKTKQNKTKQNKTKQNKTKQNKNNKPIPPQSLHPNSSNHTTKTTKFLNQHDVSTSSSRTNSSG